MSMVKIKPSGATRPIDVPREVIAQSKMIAGMLEDMGDCTDVISLPQISEQTFKHVLEFCEYHRESTSAKTGRMFVMKGWEKQFCNRKDNVIFDMIVAANMLEIEPLLDLLCKTVANMIKGLTVEQIRDRFHIVNDFSPEEEAEIRAESEWTK